MKDSIIREQDKVHVCPICLEIIRNQHVTDCGHSCCWDCFRQAGFELLNTDPFPRCPICRTPVLNVIRVFEPLLKPRHEVVNGHMGDMGDGDFE